MKKKRSKETGRFINTDYSSYIGKVFNCCEIIDVFSTKTRKVAKIKCIHCGKEKEINANAIFKDRDTSCVCQEKQLEAVKIDNQQLLNNEKLRSSNTTGCTNVTHVTKSHGRAVNFYRVTIRHNKVTYYVGEFKNKTDAINARELFIKERGWRDE